MFGNASQRLRTTTAATAAVAWLTCGVEASSTSDAAVEASGNLLGNPGFESGREGWSYREDSPHWGRFEIVDSPVRSGSGAVHLHIDHAAELPPKAVEVHGVIQELSPASFPERLGGWYRIDRWEKSAERTDLYLQVVVIVWGDPRTPELVNPVTPNPRVKNYQLRHPLTGIEKPPFRLQNARFGVVGKATPVLGEWVHFDIPLREEFERLWGVVPEGFEKLSVLFEARWDNMPPGSSVRADVYYDDLFFGS